MMDTFAVWLGYVVMSIGAGLVTSYAVSFAVDRLFFALGWMETIHSFIWYRKEFQRWQKERNP